MLAPPLMTLCSLSFGGLLVEWLRPLGQRITDQLLEARIASKRIEIRIDAFGGHPFSL